MSNEGMLELLKNCEWTLGSAPGIVSRIMVGL